MKKVIQLLIVLYLISFCSNSYAKNLGLISSYNGTAVDVYISDTTAYVAGDKDGLLIFNVSNPSTPVLLGSYYTPKAYGVYVYDNKAYVADFKDGLLIFDVSNPSSPNLIGSYDAAACNGVFVLNNIAFLVSSSGAQDGLLLIDVSNPKTPSLLGTYDVENSQSVYVIGTNAYVVYSNGFFVIDISNPESPKLLGSHTIQNPTYDVYVNNSTAYVAHVGGLTILDVSNPSTPVYLGSYETPEASGIFIEGSMAYITDRQSGLILLDISNPISPTLLGIYDTGGDVLDLYVSSARAYVADFQKGFYIIGYGELPVADAGTDQIVNEGENIILDGSNSYDVDGSISSYKWTQTNGITVNLSDTSSSIPTFTAPMVGISGDLLSFQLTVKDNEYFIFTDTVSISVSNVPQKPKIESLSKKKGSYGNKITIKGSNFLTVKNKVLIADSPCDIVSWNDTKIRITVPWGINAGWTKLYVTNDDGNQNDKGIRFFYRKPKPRIKSLSSKKVMIGKTIILKGKYFGPEKGKVIPQGVSGNIKKWSNNKISISISEVRKKNIKFRIKTIYGKSNWATATRGKEKIN